MTISGARVQTFLDMIAATRDARVTELSAQARAEADEIVRDARAEARANVRRAVVENRARSEEALAAARAELGTMFRRSSQDAHRSALVDANRLLEQTLLDRWSNALTRQAWIAALVADAVAVLPRVRFRIEHPPDWSPNELGGALGELASHCGVAPELVPASEVGAGLRFSACSAVLDGTLEGLLARRSVVEGKLLAEVDAGLETRDGS